MHPANHAVIDPGKPAAIMAGSGERLTYGELDGASNRGAHLLRSLGLTRGDGIAVMSKNQLEYFVYYWAALRAALYFTPVSTHLSTAEAAYIINDSAAKVVILSPEIGGVAEELAVQCASLSPASSVCSVRQGHLLTYRLGLTPPGFSPDTPIADQAAGGHMFYLSGTTGSPKGIKAPLREAPFDAEFLHEARCRDRYGAGRGTIYLSPAPCRRDGTFRCGADARGDREISRYLYPGGPTMFVRMLKLPDAVREKYDVSSLTCALHAAAPCTKHQMMRWWGPIIHEFYGGSEAKTAFSIESESSRRIELPRHLQRQFGANARNARHDWSGDRAHPSSVLESGRSCPPGPATWAPTHSQLNWPPGSRRRFLHPPIGYPTTVTCLLPTRLTLSRAT